MRHLVKADGGVSFFGFPGGFLALLQVLCDKANDNA
jgi:hypothetical protein